MVEPPAGTISKVSSARYTGEAPGGRSVHRPDGVLGGATAPMDYSPSRASIPEGARRVASVRVIVGAPTGAAGGALSAPGLARVAAARPPAEPPGQVGHRPQRGAGPAQVGPAE